MKTKLTKELIEEICKRLRASWYAKVAAESVGISESTYYRWIERGKKASELEEKGKKVPESEKIYREFWESVRQSDAVGEGVLITAILSKIKEDWRAALEILSRKYHERWGRRESIKVEKEVSLKEQDSKALQEFLKEEKLLTPKQREKFIKIALEFEKDVAEEEKEYEA
ncbi:hypothetical protein ES703_43069 [subsurface metagenome]